MASKKKMARITKWGGRKQCLYSPSIEVQEKTQGRVGEASFQRSAGVGTTLWWFVLASVSLHFYLTLTWKRWAGSSNSTERSADDTQLHSFTSGQVNEATEMLIQCLEAVRVWMGRNRLQPKMECLWLFRSPEFSFIFNSQWTGRPPEFGSPSRLTARLKSRCQLVVHICVPTARFPVVGGPSDNSPCPSHFPIGLLQSAQHTTVLEK